MGYVDSNNDTDDNVDESRWDKYRTTASPTTIQRAERASHNSSWDWKHPLHLRKTLPKGQSTGNVSVLLSFKCSLLAWNSLLMVNQQGLNF